jgi:glycerophosphoryl diester phosphodiesterase
MQQRLPSQLSAPVAFAHRGARAFAPENTIEAFALGLEMGATGLESDVWITADGVAVLDHDGLVKRTLGRGKPIAGFQRSQLPAHIPSLTDLIENCGSEYHLSLDLKDPQSGQAVIDVIREIAPSMLERLWLCSPVWESLLPLRGHGAKLVDSTRLQRIKEGPERRAALLMSNGIDAINLHHSEWSGGLVVLFHRFERIAFGWDMQEPHILERCLRMGLDGVYSDYPDRMMQAYREHMS